MRVLFMVPLWMPNHNAGAETTAGAFAGTLASLGHQVSVQLSIAHPMFATGPYTYDGVSVYPYVDQYDPLRWLDMPDKPDLIVCYLSDTLRASILGDMHGIPVVVLMHNGHLKSMTDLRWGARLVVYNTVWMREATESWWRESQFTEPPHGIVIHPPVFPDQYQVTPPSAARGCVTLVNLFEEKGSDLFYRLAARFPRLKFLGVCGAYGTQDIRHGLPNVEIVPHVPAHDMTVRVYARTRVLLMPSVYESFGRVGVEAACSGIPTIAHPTPGLVEALGDGGTFCDRDDLEAWVIALRSLSTPRGWAAASARARAVADRLDTAGDLVRWVDAVEATAKAVSVATAVGGSLR